MTKTTISQDKLKLDFEMIFNFLSTAYWSKGRTRSMVEISIENSLCFGVYDKKAQIGFARVVTDKIIFAYIMDVFIISEYRGNGHGGALMEHILNDQNLKDVQNWLLATADAHDLYSKYGFKPLKDPSKMMGLTSF